MEIRGGVEIQKYLFDVISKSISKPFKMADIVSELLNISPDAAYRRIRGDVELSVTELSVLCRRFNVSFDELQNQRTANSVLFQYNRFDYIADKRYLSSLFQITKLLKETKCAGEHELIVSIRYIPFWLCSGKKELTYFLMYVWYDVIHKEKINFDEFFNKLNFSEMLALCNQMMETYDEFPSKEIWTKQTFEYFLQLLNYYWKFGAFQRKQTVQTILNQLEQMVNKVESFAESGFKDKAKEIPFHLYISPVDKLDHYLLIRNGEKYVFGLRLFSINTIFTDNPILCQEAKNWLNSIIENSNMISNVSAVERRLFFENVKLKIEKTRKAIKL